MLPAFKNKATIHKGQDESWTIPDWPCPYCNIGLLGDPKIKELESNESKSQHKEMGWDPEYIKGIALGTLVCNRKKCSESVTFIGDYSVSVEVIMDSDGTGSGLNYFDVVTPLYFNPPLRLIHILPAYPRNIQFELGASFRLYWNEPESCANKIRNCVELILTELKIPRYTKSKKFIPLHHRIEKLDKKFDPEKTHLMALKIIGNPGSHGQKIDSLDLVNAYEILDHVLNRIYSNEEKRITKVSKTYLKK